MSDLDQKQIDRLYKLMEEKEQSDPDVAASLRWAIFNLEQQDRQQAPHDFLTRKDYLELWGYLEILKTNFETKARDTAQRGDDLGDKLTGDYLRQAQADRAMQEKVNTKANNMAD